MFIKYIMQSSSTIQKIEYDFVPVWIAQMVPSGHLTIYLDTSVPPKTPYYIIIRLFDQMFDD